MNRLTYKTITVFVTLALIRPVFAQIPTRMSSQAAASAQSPTAQPVPEDQLGRSTPYGTVKGFLSAAQDQDFVRASKYLDSQESLERKEEIARQLKLVMDRGLRVDLEKLSRKPEGSAAADLESNQETIGVARSGSHKLDIVLDRVQRGNQPVWLFSSGTLLSVPDFAKGLEAPWIETILPKDLVESRPFGIPLYRWISLPVSVLLGFAVACGLVWLISLAFRTLLRGFITRYDLKVPSFIGPLRVLVFTLLMQIVSRVAPTLVARLFWEHLATLLTVVGIAWLLMRGLDVIADSITERIQLTTVPGRIAIVHLARGVTKGLIVAIGLLVMLAIEGINTTAVITGLGVGGIAIAFAAQKTIENLFGTITIVSDQPIRVGDFCKVDGQMGTVERIGLRSTRLRTPGRSIVTVPNGQLASVNLENYSVRDMFLCNHVIGLRYETSADQLRFVMAEIRRLLYQHPKIQSESARVRFVRFGSSSLDVEIFAYIHAPDYVAFLAVQEDLLLRIMDIIEASGTGVAFPSQVTYFAKDTGLHSEKTEAAMAEVRRWRDERKLPFPDYSPETIRQVENKLQYPPDGSALSGNR